MFLRFFQLRLAECVQKKQNKNQIGRKICGLNRCISNLLCLPMNDALKMEPRFPRIDSMSKILSYSQVEQSRFLRFEKRKGGKRRRSRVAPNLCRMNLSRRSILEPTKLNCSLSASIGHFCLLKKNSFFFVK